MPADDRSTSPLAVLVVALLTIATIGFWAFVVASTPTGAVAAATGTPALNPPSAVADSSPVEATQPPVQSPSAGPEASVQPSASPAGEPVADPVLAMNLYR